MRVQIDTYSALARDETLKGLAKLQRASKEYANAALVNTGNEIPTLHIFLI
jgi:hypothetical protein